MSTPQLDHRAVPAADGTILSTSGHLVPNSRGAVLLISGADTPANQWSAELLNLLVSQGFSWVRFDHRDVGATGKSVERYDLNTMATDVAAIAHLWGFEQMHMIGSSMGAMVGQLVAINYPELVQTLTLFHTSPGVKAGCTPASPLYLEALTELVFSDKTEAEIAEAATQLLTGTRYESAPVQLPEATATTRHGLAVETTAPWHDRLGEVAVPSLIVHGSADPLFGPDHGRFLADNLPNSTLVELDGLGHEAPDALFVEIAVILVAHLGS